MDGDRGQRLWRLRRLHEFVDAELHEIVGGTEAEVQFFYNGTFSYARRYPSRQLAVSDAAAKRAELERQGWMFHW